jgi:hypothetical protein
MDIDGVEDGDQGKNRTPHDHFEDYGEASLYNSVSALKRYALGLNPAMFIDLHCPSKWNDEHDRVFMVNYARAQSSKFAAFGDILKKVTAARRVRRISYTGEFDLQPGQKWVVSNPQSVPCAYFYNRYAPRSPLCLSVEISYFGINVKHTASRLNRFGADFADAISAAAPLL